MVIFFERQKVNKMQKETERKRSAIGEYFHNLLDMRSNMLSYDELNEMMKENTVIHGANMWILMLAILIASIGLNVNSTAVIIGAMLISPLMSGILTMGYSLAIRDISMLKHAASRFATQVIISLITSTVYFLLSPLHTATSEMIARTSPTLWDVLIALFGGIAGGIGNTRQKTSNVIPGVAIATALMPPLCTVGYGIATAQLSFILGAAYLFLINTLFIALSAFFVTKLLRVPVHTELDAKKEKKIRRAITAAVVITVIPSVLFAGFTVYKSVLEKNADDYLKKEFVFSETQLVQSSVDYMEKNISVSLVGMQISDDRIGELENKLSDYDLGGFTLHVTQNKSIEGEADSDKVTIAVQESTIRDLQSQLEKEKEENDRLNESLGNITDCSAVSKKASEVFTDIKDIRVGLMYGENGQYILLSGVSEKELSDSEKQIMENFLKSESGVSEAVLDIDIETAEE